MDPEKNNIEELPLIPMQKGMLFHAISAPGSGVDVQHISMTLHEVLDINKFRAAWNQVVQRHSALRSAFQWEDIEEPTQLIYPAVTLPITEIDWSQLAEADSEEQFESLLEIDRLQGFDLSNPPLMRMTIVRLNGSISRCLWSFHHIILDGRSFPVVLQEVFQIYDALIEGADISLPEPFPFADFVNILENHDHSGSENYWRALLDNISAPTPLGLNSGRMNGPVASATANEVSFLSEHVAQKLNIFARDIGVTLNTLVQGAWGLLLAHYTGEREIVFGNTRSGRNLYEPARDSVGLFINTTPVRLTITPEQTLVEYLRGLRAQQIAVREHESTPLSQIQKWTEIDGSDPLFHTLVVFENYDLNSALRRNGGKWLKRKFSYQGQTSFPLTLMAYSDSQITFRIEYDPEVYTQQVVNKILNHLKTMLQSMAERPYVPAHSLPYLTEDEIDFLANKINPRISPSGLEETVFETFVQLAKKIPAKDAVSDANRSLSYRELADRANQLGHYLINLGVKPNEPVGICMNRSVDMVISMLAVMASGGAFVPLDPTFPRDRLAHMLEDSNMKILISEGDLLNALPIFQGRLIVPNRDREDIFRQPVTAPKTSSRFDDTAYIIYTSGSTGKPKGVQVPHRAVTNFMLTMQATPGLTEDDILTAVTTISFDISVLEIMLPLFVGGKLIIAPQEATTDGRALAQIIADSGTTVMQATPATWRLLIDSGWDGVEGLKILCGGEKLTNDLAKELLKRGDSLWNMYGPTETTIWSLVANITDDLVQSQNPLPIGRPIANTSIFILDEQMQLVPMGAMGELCIGGQGVTSGYLNRAELTAEKFVENKFGDGLLYRTGDMARYLPNKEVICLGRRDNQLKVRGFRIEPGEVESVLLTQASVSQAIVVGRPTSTGNTQLAAYVILDEDSPTTVSELRKYSSTRLPDYMVPSVWVFLDAFPLTDNGKINRNALPEPSGERPALENPYVAPKSDIEKQIASIWQNILNVKTPGVHDNFFDLGGDSLLVVRVLTKLRNQFGSGLAVHDLYSSRTIRTLSERIEELQGAVTKPIESPAQPKKQELDDASHSAPTVMASVQPEIVPEPVVEDRDELEVESHKQKLESSTEEIDDDGFDLFMQGDPEVAESAETPASLNEEVVEPIKKEDADAASQDFNQLVNFEDWQDDWTAPVESPVQETVLVDASLVDDAEKNQADTENQLDGVADSKILDEMVEDEEEDDDRETGSGRLFDINFSSARLNQESDEDDSEDAVLGDFFKLDFEKDNPLENSNLSESDANAEQKEEKPSVLPETFNLEDLEIDQALLDESEAERELPIALESTRVVASQTEVESTLGEVFDLDFNGFESGESRSIENIGLSGKDEGAPILPETFSLDDLSIESTDQEQPEANVEEVKPADSDSPAPPDVGEAVASHSDEVESDGEAPEIDVPVDDSPMFVLNLPDEHEDEASNESVNLLQSEPALAIPVNLDESTNEPELADDQIVKDETLIEESTILEVDSAPAVTDDLGILEELAQSGSANEAPSKADSSNNDIAVIGMSGRFPGANNLDEFWNNLVNGVEGLRHLTEDELRGVEIHYDEYKNDPEYVAATGLLEDVDMFDAAFFGIKPVEARTLDPQQRLWFETAWETLENGGYDPGRYQGKIGVFAGSFMNSYVFYNLLPDRDTIEDFVRLQAPEAFMHMINNERDYMPTRTSYLFDLKGPAINVQTACSTSLVAVNLACRSILSGESDMALAGGVAIFLPQERGYFYQEGGMRSADGHCRPFDAQASGTVFASGLGCVLLKKLDQAIADGDNVVAVIKGSALNNDGSFKASYTAPSIAGQADVIRQARVNAGVSADSISYIEAHGTATPLGDPIEIAGLSRAFDDRSASADKIALGAVKSNIGHLDAAAGIAGLLKTILSLQNETIAPTLHYTQANSEIDFENSPFYVADKAIAWPKNLDQPRRAGLSSFGVGGTNAHLILEEAPALRPTSGSRPRQLLLLSAKSATALEKQAENLANWLEQNTDADLADVAYTLTVGRAQHIHRRVVAAADVDEAIKNLRNKKCGAKAELRTAEPEIVFMFPGQGAQFVGMGRELYAGEPVYKDAIDHCAEILEGHLNLDMRDILYPADESDGDAAHQLKQTGLAQPAIFMVSYAQAMLWQSWGITPDLMVGHSVGEFVAATLSGVYSLPDALKLIAGRARLMQDLPGGSMRAIRMTEEELEPWLDMFEDVSLAAVNAPAVCIVSGPTDTIDRFDHALEAAEFETIELHTSHAFHSSMMDEILAPFDELVDSVDKNAPAITLISTLTGEEMSDAEATSSTYWTSQLRQAVLFSPAVQKLIETPNRIFLEVGPGTNLSTSVRQHLPKSNSGLQLYFVIDSLGHASKQLPALQATLEGLGKLWMSGAEPNFDQYYAAEQRQRVALPTYPFERKRFWIDPPAVTQNKTNEAASSAAIPEAVAPEAITMSASTPEQTMSAAPINQPIADPIPSQKESSMGRNENIKQALVELLYDLSGIEIGVSDHDTSFPELGFDSLTLTQVSTALRKQMSVSIRFRKLLEDVATINDLTAFCAETLPADAYAPKAAPAAPAPQAPAQQPAQHGVPQAGMYQMPQMPQMFNMPDPNAMMANPMQMQMMQMQQMMMFMQQQMAMMGMGQNPVAQSGPVQTVEKVVEVGRRWPKAPEKDGDDTVNKVTFGPYKPIKKGEKGKLTAQQQAWLDDFMIRLQAKTSTSKKIAQENRDVQADPRTVAGFRQTWKEIVYQIVTQKSKGSRVWDVDDNEYVDITMGFGVSFLGHSPDFVTKAVKAQLDKGIEIGPQGQLAGEVARMFREVTGMERVSFCNTGSEALMASMRMARTITGRDKVVYFSGDYHGVFDEVLARPQVIRGDLMTVPAAPGVTQDAVANAIILDYGTDASLAFIREHKDDIAAVIIETVQSRHPENRPVEFVKELRKITAESGAALVFDEVITGFRVHQGGMQKIYDVKPDLACYGKIIGGGIPIGVVAGDPRFMDTIDGGQWQYGDDSIPEVDLTFFAGTFVRHPMALAAAKAVLTFLMERGPSLQEWMNERTTRFAEDMNGFFEDQGVPIKINHYSSWFRVEVPTDYAYPDLIFYSLLEKGVYVFTFAQNCFFSIAHTDEDIEFIKQAFKDTVVDLQKGGFLPTGGNSPVPFPLTEAQKEIWLASQISQKAATSYNEGFSITLKGDLNQEHLVHAVQKVICRHGALHSRFDLDGETQRLADDKNVEVVVLDFSDQSAEDAQKSIGKHIDSLMSQPFDLNEGPLVRPSLVKLSAKEHVLLWVADHVVYDGWSAVIVISEVRALYNGASAGFVAELEPPDSFRDYVAWEQETAAGEEGKEILEYWKGRFANLPPVLDLPGDQPRPPVRSYSASSVHYEFQGDLINQISNLAKTWRTSTFVVMLAAYKAMLYRLSGNEDLVVGIHTAGQAQAGLDNLVGHAVSILPIRSEPNEHTPFDEFVTQVKNSFLDAQDHQPFTFGQLLQNLNIPRDSSRSPLVEVVFNLDKKVPEEEFFGLTQSIREISKQATNWDLFLNLYEEEGTLKADCDFNADLFGSTTVLGWLDSLSILLDSIVANSKERLSDLAFFPDSGLSAEMLGWNQTERIYPADLTLPEIVSRQAGQIPFKPAILDDDKTLTYREVDQRANLLSRYFQTIGVSPGMLVGLCLERSADMVVAALAIMRAGAAYVPMDPDYPIDRLIYMIEDSGMPFIVTHSAVVDRLPNSARLIILDEEEPSISGESNAPLASLARPSEAAYMIYTSGSSGRPKGVLVPHKALVNFLYSMQSQPGMSAEDILVSVTTLSFDIAALELYLPLMTGARLAIARPEVSTDGLRLARLLTDVEATMMQATPATWKLLLDSGWTGHAGLKMMCGGEPLSRQLADELLKKGGELWNMYGPTETTIWSSIAQITDDSGAISIGRPIANTQIYILNPQMRPVPVGVEGDLYIGGHGLALGYYKRPELTAERFVANPLGSGKLYKTGDIAKFDSDGSIICLGRADNQVKIRGFRIELGEIESVLMDHASVSDAVVMVREDEPGDKRIVAYTIQSKTVPVADLRDSAAAKLPYYMVPSAWMTMDTFPLTPNGKIDRLAFSAPEQGREVVATRYTAPETETEKRLTQIWGEVLKINPETIGTQDDFFELGGHSLLATRVISRVRQQLGASLSLLTFFEGATVAALAEKVGHLTSGKNGHGSIAQAVLDVDSSSEEDSDREEFVI
ncbi:MAG: amino acid adenylation domain-containing protein [Anaerolineae bacterium]